MGRAARLRNRQKYLDRVNAEERAKCGVPVFYLEQDTAAEPPGQGQRTRTEVQELKKLGLGCFINHGKAFRLYESVPAPPRPPVPSDSGNSDATIAVNEMRANVGEPPPEPGAMLARGTRKRAQQKIRAIGGYETGTTDMKAPLARRRRRRATLLLQRPVLASSLGRRTVRPPTSKAESQPKPGGAAGIEPALPEY